MFLYRSLTVGLLGACCFMLARSGTRSIEIRMAPLPTPPSIAAALATRPALQVIDVAANAAPDQVARLVTLAPGERIVAVDDAEVGEPVAAVLQLVTSASRGHDFVDVTVRGDAGERRVLLLRH